MPARTPKPVSFTGRVSGMSVQPKKGGNIVKFTVETQDVDVGTLNKLINAGVSGNLEYVQAQASFMDIEEPDEDDE